jgi:hypothetical protein
MLDSGEPTTHTEEIPTLHHIIKKEDTLHSIHNLTLEDGTSLTTTREMPRAFGIHLRGKYDTEHTDTTCLQQLMNNTASHIPKTAEGSFATPITLGEFHYAVKQGRRSKSPGHDGISYEFYQTHWETKKGRPVSYSERDVP